MGLCCQGLRAAAAAAVVAPTGGVAGAGTTATGGDAAVVAPTGGATGAGTAATGGDAATVAPTSGVIDAGGAATVATGGDAAPTNSAVGGGGDTGAIVAPTGGVIAAGGAAANVGGGGALADTGASAIARGYLSSQTDVFSGHSHSSGRCSSCGCQSHLLRCKRKKNLLAELPNFQEILTVMFGGVRQDFAPHTTVVGL